MTVIISCNGDESISRIKSQIIHVSTVAGGSEGFSDGQCTVAQFRYPYGVAADAVGNIYVADSYNHLIRKITPAGLVSTLAGQAEPGFADGPDNSSQFNQPQAVAVDADGNIFVADSYNHRIRKITPSGIVSTVAGSTQGYTDGPGPSALFNYPSGIAIDASGNIYVGDNGNHRIRKINLSGVVSTLAGSTPGNADGTGISAQFHYPIGVAVDMERNVYVADAGNHQIRKITPSGFVTTLAGSAEGFADGICQEAMFNQPWGITVDSKQNIYVTDGFNNRIRKISPTGSVSTIAGQVEGYLDSEGLKAQFSYPAGIAIDMAMNLYVADFNNSRIRKISFK